MVILSIWLEIYLADINIAHNLQKKTIFYILTFLFVTKATDTPEFPSGNIQTSLLKQIVIHWFLKILDYARFKTPNQYTGLNELCCLFELMTKSK